MHTKSTQLKTPDLFKPKSRKHSDSPVFKSPLSTALGLGQGLTKPSPLPKQPMTPNLDTLTQSRPVKPERFSAKQKKFMKFATQSIQDFRQFDSETSCEQFQENTIMCQSHTNKTAKYFLQRNPTVGLCTKCAIAISETQPLLDEQKHHKTQQIQKFKQMVSKLDHLISTKSQQKQQTITSLHQQRTLALSNINHQFQILINHIHQKQFLIITDITNRYQEAITRIQQHSKKIVLIKGSIERYVQDIDRNYWDIVHNLSRNQFDEIMQQYHYKIDGCLPRINQGYGEVGRVRGAGVELKGVMGAVEELGRKEEEKERQREKNKENQNSLNFKTVRAKPRTPHRKVI